MRGEVLVGAALLFVVGSVGCGGGGLRDATGPVHRFPSRAELEQIGRTPPVPLEVADAVSVDAWELRPESATATAATGGAWDALLSEATRGLAAARLPAMDCAAAELARFYGERGGLPDQRLRRFIAGSCGGTAPEPAVYVSGGTADPSLSDEQVAAAWREQLVPVLRQNLQGNGSSFVGFNVLRSGSNVSVGLVWARRDAELDGWPVALDEQRRIRISGVLRVPAEQLTGLINQGRFGVAECELDRSERLPRFALRCPLAQEDQLAWLELDVREPGRLLAKRVLEVLVQAEPGTARTFQAEAGTSPVQAANSAQLRSAFLEQVNAVRQAASLGPLALASKQSFQNDVLAPHYFHAALGDDTTTMDQVALGLMAGWDVRGGMIQDSGILTQLLWGTRDVTSMVGYMLDHPIGRHVLLAPDARQLAVGAIVGEKSAGIGVIATTYEFFDHRTLAADRERVTQKLARARQERRLPAQRRLGAPELGAEAARIRSEHKNPGDALQAAMQRTSASLGQPVMGYLLSTTSLDHVQFPEPMLAAMNPSVAIEVVHYRAPGGAWGQYLVLALAADVPADARAIAQGGDVGARL